jgi:hypothetical protein
MANQLKMVVVHAILTLAGLGWSQRGIAEHLGIHRETVARYVRSPPVDSRPATSPIPGFEVVGVAAGSPIRGPESHCEPFRAVIEEKLRQGLTGQRIIRTRWRPMALRPATPACGGSSNVWVTVSHCRFAGWKCCRASRRRWTSAPGRRFCGRTANVAAPMSSASS